MSPLGGIRGAEPSLPSGRWSVSDVFAGRYGFVPIGATGGTIQDVTINDLEYRVHIFTTVGSSQAFEVHSVGTTD